MPMAALREARNRDEFLALAQAVLGHPVEVISGREEARLIYAGVARLQPGDAPRLVIDIGGRSTELILGRGLQVHAAESFAVGSVGLSMRYFDDGRLRASAFEAAEVAAGAAFEEGQMLFTPERWAEALGSSGTVSAVAEVLRANGQSDGQIDARGLRWCVAQCVKAGHVNRLELPGLKGDRQAVLPGGLAILSALLSQFKIERLAPARGALRQGVLFDLAQRLQGPSQSGDRRNAAVAALARRFACDETQAERVRSFALGLLHQLRPGDDSAAQELAWAASLHEAGMAVSHHDHHRHCAYVVAHADLDGFSQTQQRRLAALVLAQRGGLRKVAEPMAEPGFALAALCLRLAIVKCHGRVPVDMQAWKLLRSADAVQLSYASDWPAQRPRTHHLLREEAQAWARQPGWALLLPRE
jgi:exopolyphosphatase / guanosine-5'-triphosphate,3'-diphosphate pyrophosphatase